MIKIRIIINYLLLLLMFFFSVNQRVTTLLFFPIILLVIFNKVTFFSLKKHYLFPVFYILFFVSSLQPDFIFSFVSLEQKAVLLIVPLIFINIKLSFKQTIDLLKYFYYGVVFSIILTFCFSLFKNQLFFLNFIFNYKKASNFLNFNWYYSYSGIYQSMYYVFALTCIIIFRKEMKIHKLFYIFSIILITFSILEIGSIIGVFLLLVVISFLFYHKKNYFKNKYLFLIIPFLFSFVIYFVNLKQLLGTRYYTWKSSLILIKDNFIFGLGNTSQVNLDTLYLNAFYNDFSTFNLKLGLNSHNLYLQLLLEGGIFLFSAFLIIIFNFYKSINTYNSKLKLLGQIFLVIIVVTSFGESIFNRYLGLSFFSVFYFILIKNSSYLFKK